VRYIRAHEIHQSDASSLGFEEPLKRTFGVLDEQADDCFGDQIHEVLAHDIKVRADQFLCEHVSGMVKEEEGITISTQQRGENNLLMSSVSTCSLSAGDASRRSMGGTGGRFTASCRAELAQRFSEELGNGAREDTPTMPAAALAPTVDVDGELAVSALAVSATPLPTASLAPFLVGAFPTGGDINCSCASVSLSPAPVLLL
jgi:hypothetical protein